MITMNNREQVIKLFRQGMSYAEVGRRVGLSRQRVMQIVKPPTSIYEHMKRKARGICANCEVIAPSGRISGYREGTLEVSKYKYLCASCYRNEASE